METVQLPQIIEKQYDIHNWLLLKVKKFPRELRYFIGTSIYDSSKDLLDALTAAYYTPQADQKFIYLNQASITLEQLRIHLRVAFNQKIINAKSLQFVVQLLLEIGKILGAWLKSIQP